MFLELWKKICTISSCSFKINNIIREFQSSETYVLQNKIRETLQSVEKAITYQGGYTIWYDQMQFLCHTAASQQQMALNFELVGAD